MKKKASFTLVTFAAVPGLLFAAWGSSISGMLSELFCKTLAESVISTQETLFVLISMPKNKKIKNSDQINVLSPKFLRYQILPVLIPHLSPRVSRAAHSNYFQLFITT